MEAAGHCGVPLQDLPESRTPLAALMGLEYLSTHRRVTVFSPGVSISRATAMYRIVIGV